jgi:hypothetical protein
MVTDVRRFRTHGCGGACPVRGAGCLFVYVMGARGEARLMVEWRQREVMRRATPPRVWAPDDQLSSRLRLRLYLIFRATRPGNALICRRWCLWIRVVLVSRAVDREGGTPTEQPLLASRGARGFGEGDPSSKRGAPCTLLAKSLPSCSRDDLLAFWLEGLGSWEGWWCEQDGAWHPGL